MNFSSLPSRVRYLQPVLEQLQNGAGDEHNGDADTPLLESLVRQRVGGLTKVEANQVLEEDRRALIEWAADLPSYQSPVYSVVGELIGVELYLVGANNVDESLSILISNLPSPPPSREFGPLPEIKPLHCKLLDENGNVYLYLGNTASAPEVVDLHVSIDDIDVVWDAFDWHPNIFTRYRIQLAKGRHRLIAESQRGQARLEKTFSVSNTLHIGIAYSYSKPGCYSQELPPVITFHSDEKPWIPDYGWKHKQE
jgi:hypothetical protein